DPHHLVRRHHGLTGARPMPFESLPQTSQVEIDQRCDEFEAAWRAGRNPRIEEFLGTETGPVRTELFREVLKLEIGMRRDAGERPTPNDYLERFPADAEVLDAEFSTASVEPREGSKCPPGPVDLEAPGPEWIGRYRVYPNGLLGGGNFRVYR